MAKLDNIKRLIVEDFPKEDQELVGKMAYILNSFMEQVVREFNGNVDFSNLHQDIVSITIEVDAGGTPIGNNLVKTIIKNAGGVVVTSALNKTTNGVYPTTAPFVSFTASGNIIKIVNVKGLQANNKYLLTLLVLPR